MRRLPASPPARSLALRALLVLGLASVIGSLAAPSLAQAPASWAPLLLDAVPLDAPTHAWTLTGDGLLTPAASLPGFFFTSVSGSVVARAPDLPPLTRHLLLHVGVAWPGSVTGFAVMRDADGAPLASLSELNGHLFVDQGATELDLGFISTVPHALAIDFADHAWGFSLDGGTRVTFPVAAAARAFELRLPAAPGNRGSGIHLADLRAFGEGQLLRGAFGPAEPFPPDGFEPRDILVLPGGPTEEPAGARECERSTAPFDGCVGDFQREDTGSSDPGDLLILTSAAPGSERYLSMPWLGGSTSAGLDVAPFTEPLPAGADGFALFAGLGARAADGVDPVLWRVAIEGPHATVVVDDGAGNRVTVADASGSWHRVEIRATPGNVLQVFVGNSSARIVVPSLSQTERLAFGDVSASASAVGVVAMDSGWSQNAPVDDVWAAPSA